MQPEELDRPEQPESIAPTEQEAAETPGTPETPETLVSATTTTRFDKFTQHARKALALAQRVARQMRSNDIRSEHLLLGLVGVKESTAARALASIGLDVASLQFELAMRGMRDMGRRKRGERVQAGQKETKETKETKEPVGLTGESKRIIERSVALAQEAGQPRVSTEHLLLALLDEPECAAAALLRSLHYLPEIVRAAVAQALRQRGAGESTTATDPSIVAPGSGAKNNVVTCRLDDQTLAAVDLLVEVGIRSSRSDAVAWLISTGLQAHRDLFARLQSTAETIRQLRADFLDAERNNYAVNQKSQAPFSTT